MSTEGGALLDRYDFEGDHLSYPSCHFLLTRDDEASQRAEKRTQAAEGGLMLTDSSEGPIFLETVAILQSLLSPGPRRGPHRAVASDPGRPS